MENVIFQLLPMAQMTQTIRIQPESTTLKLKNANSQEPAFTLYQGYRFGLVIFLAVAANNQPKVMKQSFFRILKHPPTYLQLA